jgi:hypothetical protein
VWHVLTTHVSSVTECGATSLTASQSTSIQMPIHCGCHMSLPKRLAPSVGMPQPLDLQRISAADPQAVSCLE